MAQLVVLLWLNEAKAKIGQRGHFILMQSAAMASAEQKKIEMKKRNGVPACQNEDLPRSSIMNGK